MRYAASLFLLVALAPPLVTAQPSANTAPDTMISAVAYVDTRADAAADAQAALARYRTRNLAHSGCERLDVFEQIGRPGHFTIIEAWRDQGAFDGRDAAARQELLATLEPLRVSGYDERLYKTLTRASETAPATRRSVFVVSHVDVAPNTEAPQLLERLAVASRREPGNLRFDVVQHTMRANHFTVIEHWRDQQSFDSHVAAPHTRQYRDALQPLTGSPLDERVYSAVSGNR